MQKINIFKLVLSIVLAMMIVGCSEKRNETNEVSEIIGAQEEVSELNTTNNTIKSPSLEKLELSSPQIYFTRQIDTFYKDYVPVQSPIKVLATYSDGHTEEVTDQVEWKGVSGNIAMGTDYFRAAEGKYILKASLSGVESNEITIEVKNDTSLFQYEITYNETYNQIVIAATLLNKPTQKVVLTLKLRPEDKVGFEYHVNREMKQNYSMTFNPEDWDNQGNRQEVTLSVLDESLLDDIVVITEPFESEDTSYRGVNPKDIVLKRKPELILNAPSLETRKGAIRGVPIKFRVTTGNQLTNVRLINPPKGMKVIGKTFIENTELYGIDVQWDVPMDAEEGKFYNITAKTTDKIGRTKTITFFIKVTKTKDIKTKITNNELIVTDKNSKLYGMKMKGHNGENIAKLKLRSVEYRDVWSQYIENKNPEDVVERSVFILDNIPEALDIKFPSDMDSVQEAIALDIEIYKYAEGISIGENFWDFATMQGYEYENTNGLVLFKKVNGKYSVGPSNVFLLVVAKAQNRIK